MAIAELCARDRRIRAVPQKKNTGISGATNTAIATAKGEYIALFDHDDMLLDVAVEIMVEAALKTGAKMLYSDEDKVDDFGRYSDPNLKSDWNYRLMLGQNYVCHFLIVEAATLRAVGHFGPSMMARRITTWSCVCRRSWTRPVSSTCQKLSITGARRPALRQQPSR